MKIIIEKTLFSSVFINESAGHVARVAKRNAYTFFVDNVKERGHLKDLGVDKRSKAIAAVELSSSVF